MMKKLGAIALTATMMLSLIGCGKKNFDGNYTADVDLSVHGNCHEGRHGICCRYK
jgi:hypothetical protein